MIKLNIDEIKSREKHVEGKDELLRMLKGNITRIVLSDDCIEINSMAKWAKLRIDYLCKIRKNELISEGLIIWENNKNILE